MKSNFFYTILLALVMTFVTSAGSIAQNSTLTRINGYRVQVYTGGNTRQAKTEANQMAQRAKIWFPEHNSYTVFLTPHWTCRVGDFKSHAEAEKLLGTMRETKRFPKAVIVRCKINIRTDELRKEATDSCTTGDPTTYTPHP